MDAPRQAFDSRRPMQTAAGYHSGLHGEGAKTARAQPIFTGSGLDESKVPTMGKAQGELLLVFAELFSEPIAKG